ncbi:vacuolar fusion protein MON1 [Entophlyctis helioformis]|nr:vacuolar fusion protein MON1 [Entophlyctis helioformis]
MGDCEAVVQDSGERGQDRHEHEHEHEHEHGQAGGRLAAQDKAKSVLSLLEEDARPSNRGGYQRKHGNQGPNSPLWKAHKKHFFILSAAGKPIYTRYGDETKLSSFIGVIQAIISFYADEDDTLRSITAGGHLFVFLARGPLYLVAVSCTGESEEQLRHQLLLLFNQITLTLTTVQLNRIFEQRVNFDLRTLLSGTEVFMDSLCKTFQGDPGIFLDATRCLAMPPRLRDRVAKAMVEASPPKQLLFGLLFSKDQLVTFLRPKNYTIHPNDVSLLLNMILSSSAFRTVESWTPVCLPKFNSRGFLYAYICFLTPDLCLALLSTEKDAFFALSDYKRSLAETLEAGNMIDALQEAQRVSTLSCWELGIPNLRHFIFKSKLLWQYTEVTAIPPYTHSQDRKRLFRIYQHAQEMCVRRPVQAQYICLCTPHETVVCQASLLLLTYAVFGPLVSRSSAQAALADVDGWIRRSEDSLFMTQSAFIVL